MRVLRILSILFSCLGSESLAQGFLLGREAAVSAPDCSLPCLSTYIPQYCGSVSNTSCVCSSSDLRTSVALCAYQACDAIPDLLQLTKFSAVSCGLTSDKTRLNDVLRMDYAVPFITAWFIVGRVVARTWLDTGLGADDWTILAAALAYYVDVGTSLGLVLNGFGQHTYWLSTEQIIMALKWFYVVELFYMISITLTKLGLLLFFLRIFSSHRLRQMIWITGVFIVLSNLSILLALAFQCVPIRAYWTNWMYKEKPIQCIDHILTLHVAAVFSIVQSTIILILPIPTLWRLDLAFKKRANLFVMFSVGSLALVCSFLRLPSLIKLDNSSDPSYDQAPVVVYSHLEQSIAIICACLPACRSLLECLFPSLKMTFGESSSEEPQPHQSHMSRNSQSRDMRAERTTSTANLVELGGKPGSDWRSSSGTVSADEDLGFVFDDGTKMGSQVSVDVGFRNEALENGDKRPVNGIYMTKSVEMSSDRKESIS